GNSGTCVQRFTVRDTAPPVLTLPADMVLPCPANDTGTNVTGVATAQNACGSTQIYYSDIVSNGCNGAKVISRTWTATDDSGNSTNAVQTITVRDVLTITAPANLVLECPANTATNSTGIASATDGCSSVTISYTDSLSN